MIVVGRGHRHYHRWIAAKGGRGLFAQAHLPTLLREAQGGAVAWMAGLLVVRLELPEGGAVHCSVVSDRLCDVDPTQVTPAERALQEAVAEGLSLAVTKAGNYVGVDTRKGRPHKQGGMLVNYRVRYYVDKVRYANLGTYTTKEEAALQYARHVTAVRNGICPCCAAAVLDGDVGIACGGCDLWHHATCARVADLNAAELEELDWRCDGCKR
jgi:hypothetical protein